MILMIRSPNGVAVGKRPLPSKGDDNPTADEHAPGVENNWRVAAANADAQVARKIRGETERDELRKGCGNGFPKYFLELS
ncbi:unnamed protein product [Nesidiocoris tenuis]|uniref:Uncharacterized protein n=1 Tax=Nesidiocoris tenuis TaxID=355587 RepID=A0A6H5HCP4_9HEMI|nr:unnamed protein product [Nesidiocoris tenuis]